MFPLVQACTVYNPPLVIFQWHIQLTQRMVKVTQNMIERLLTYLHTYIHTYLLTYSMQHIPS